MSADEILNRRGASSGEKISDIRGRTSDNSPVVIHPFLTEKLQLCGYVIRQPLASNELLYDVTRFRKKLAEWLLDKIDNVEPQSAKFLDELNAYLTEHFILAMKPTKHKSELVLPSLLHCLLGIYALQPHVIKIIMPLLTEAAASTTKEDKGLVKTVLQQLKWLPFIVEDQIFTDNLLSVLDNAAIYSQTLIIKELPIIVPSHLHPKVTERLLEKFSDHGLQLNIPLMDCFSGLEIPEAAWPSIRNTAVDQMKRAPLVDIPAYLSFVFHVEQPLNSLSEIISNIRGKVELISEEFTADDNVHQDRILEKLTFLTVINPDIVAVWSELIEKDLQNGLTEYVKKIDLMLLLACVEEQQELTTNVLNLLFSETKLAVKLFSQMMTENAAMVNHLFRPISKILDSITRTGNSKCLEAVHEITMQLFFGLSPLEAQSVMGNMTSTLVNFPSCRDFVLFILTKLVEKDPKNFLQFAPHLMGVLEHAMQLLARQIKGLMNILARLSQTEAQRPGDANPFNAEFSMLLRKQLTHSDSKIRCFGVFGALATIRYMAEHSTPDNDEIVLLLKLAWSMVEVEQVTCCIFFDELSENVDAVPVEFCEEFCEVLKSKFQRLWTIDTGKTEEIQRFTKKTDLALVTTFDANRECNEERLLITFEAQPLGMNPLIIPSLFRAISVLEKKVKNGKLVGIYGFLGCPLLFPELEEYFDRDSMSLFGYKQRMDLGQYLVLAINYFRESISAFVCEKDSELRSKIWLRLEHILKLQKLLVRHLQSFPLLPCAYMTDKTVGLSRDEASLSLSAFQDTVVLYPEINEDQEADVSHPSSILDETIHPKEITIHLRRLHVSVFRLLCYPLQCEERASVNYRHPLRLQLTPEILTLLLVELKHQLSDDSCKLDIFSVKKLLKFVCGHINSIVTTFADNEENGTSLTTCHRTTLEDCLRILIGLMTSYFEAILKLDKEEKELKINHAVGLLAIQIVNTQDATYQPSQMEIIASGSAYLENLVSFIKDPTTALDHLKLLKTIHDILNGDVKLRQAIDEAVCVYLCTKWKLSPSQVDGILKIWLGTSITPFKIIKHLSKKLLPKHGTLDVNIPDSSTYKSCTDANFHVWYNAIFSGLSQYVYKNLRGRGELEYSIQEWNEPVIIFRKLMAATEKIKNDPVSASALRNCRLFLESFISGALPLLPALWTQSTDEAIQFISQLQTSCRNVIQLCDYSKRNSAKQLGKSVAATKRVLETLNFRVREVLETVPGATNDSVELLSTLEELDNGASLSTTIDDGSNKENENP